MLDGTCLRITNSNFGYTFVNTLSRTPICRPW